MGNFFNKLLAMLIIAVCTFPLSIFAQSNSNTQNNTLYFYLVRHGQTYSNIK